MDCGSGVADVIELITEKPWDDPVPMAFFIRQQRPTAGDGPVMIKFYA